MKRLIRVSALLLVVLILGTGISAMAGDMWSEEYYRANDVSDGLSDAEMNELDSLCLEFMSNYHVDLAMVALTSDRYEGSTLSEYARNYYESCGFGYGPDRDGIQMAWDTDTDEMVLEMFGSAGDLFPASYLEHVVKSAPTFREKHGIFGTMYSVTRFLSDYMADPERFTPSAANSEIPEMDPNPENASGGNVARVGEDGDLPAWYPVDPEHFQNYHDYDAPRVVDTADIFPEAEEARMSNRLFELQEELGKDIVIFTDVSTYGFERSVYAADFFDFNGYGWGDDREGVCLCICMDPNNRGWWTACSGPETMGLYTEEVANDIDDMLFDFMVEGRYAEGVEDWIENFRRLYVTGSPYTPEWALQSPEGFVRFHDGEAPRVVDDAHILSEEEIRSLTEQAAEISGKYGLDVVVHTARHPGNLDPQDFSDRYYLFNGYGLGDDYDGIALTVFKRPNHTASVSITASGIGAQKLTAVAEGRLRSRCVGKLGENTNYAAISAWLSQTEHLLRTGRAPRSAGSWIVMTFLELLVGAVVGTVSLLRARKNMASPSIRENADAYLVSGSLHVKNLGDDFLDSTVSRQYRPEKQETRSSDSGGSSSSGRSSYSSSYSGSSGNTHSGSGRNF